MKTLSLPADIARLQKPEAFGLDQVFGRLTPKKLEELINPLPQHEAHELYHIGCLVEEGQQPPTQSNGTLEGALFSVSEVPDNWRQIAKLGGIPWWEVVLEEGNFHLIEMVGKNPAWAKLDQWAQEQSLFFPQKFWHTPFSSDEDGEINFMTCQTEKEALENHDPDLGEIKVKTLLAPTENLWGFWIQRQGEFHESPCPHRGRAALLAALLEWAGWRGWTNLPQGLHWNEIDDPSNYSSPRAGLSPAQLHAQGFLLDEIHEEDQYNPIR
jgi:hypothetical protein